MQNEPTSVAVHGTALQQSAPVVHCWPYSAHVLGVPAVPPSGGGGVDPPHTPTADPVGMTHGRPGQQSAVVVHAPPASTQASPQMNGGSPAGLGTQGRLQQSALDEHASPTRVLGSVQSTLVPTQRGIPRLSCWQAHGSVWFEPPGLVTQQSAVALHDVEASLQISPAAAHTVPVLQRPTVAPVSFAHLTFVVSPSMRVALPQQSESCWQSSPVGWQPLGG